MKNNIFDTALLFEGGGMRVAHSAGVTSAMRILNTTANRLKLEKTYCGDYHLACNNWTRGSDFLKYK